MANQQAKFASPHYRKPGDGFPARSGNMKIVRDCSDEILTLREPEFGWDFESICGLIAQIFNHPSLTKKRLWDCLALVKKEDAQNAKTAARAKRVAALKEKRDLGLIMKSLETKSYKYSNRISELVEQNRLGVQPVSVVIAKPNATAVKPNPIQAVQPQVQTALPVQRKATANPELEEQLDRWIAEHIITPESINVPNRATLLEIGETSLPGMLKRLKEMRGRATLTEQQKKWYSQIPIYCEEKKMMGAQADWLSNWIVENTDTLSAMPQEQACRYGAKIFEAWKAEIVAERKLRYGR